MPSAPCLISPTTTYSGVICSLSGLFLISAVELLFNNSSLFSGCLIDTGLPRKSSFNDSVWGLFPLVDFRPLNSTFVSFPVFENGNHFDG